MARDYYEVLGVERDADAGAIKKAFKKAARQFHPDLNPNDAEAESKFKEASEAYDVLSNEEKRKIYDQFGHDGLKGRGYDPHFTDLHDIFSAFGDLFGGGFAEMFGGGRRGGGRAGPRRGADVEVPLRLEFMESVHGVTKTITVPLHAHCDTCEGTGLKTGASRSTCSTCGGHGQVIQSQGFLRIRTTCPSCRGQGSTVAASDRCDDCGGSGRVREDIEVEARVPAGAYGGLQIRHPGKGEIGDPGAPRGDLYLTLDVAPHDVFKRDGADVYVTVNVPYPVMCLGGEIRVPTVHGEEAFKVPRGTPSGEVFVMRDKGIDHLRARGSRGDQHVRLVVDVPTKLSDTEEELIRKLADTQEVGVREKGFWQDLFHRITG